MVRRVDDSEHRMDDGRTLITIALMPLAYKKLSEQADLVGESVGQIAQDLIHETLRAWD